MAKKLHSGNNHPGVHAGPYLSKLLALAMLFLITAVTAQWDTQSPMPTFFEVRGEGSLIHESAFTAADGRTILNGDFTEVTPPDSLFVTPQDEDFWVISTAPADYDNDGDLS